MESNPLLNMEDVRKVNEIHKDLGPGYGTDWVFMPDGDGNPVVAYLRRNHNSKIFGFFDDNNMQRENEDDELNYENEINYRLYTK